MRTTLFRRTVVAGLATASLSCANPAPHPVEQPASRYLFAWTGDEDREDSDFLVVVDLARDGDRYGTVAATAPIGEQGLWPHHTEHELSASKMLFANGFSSSRNVVFDLHDPLRPKVVERFNDAEKRRVVRSRSAADPTADQTTLRPYGLAVVPALDRVVVALTYMPIPTWSPLRGSIEHDHSGNQVQVYRLSDLSLIKTIRLAENEGPNEPRVLRDGRTVLVNTGQCRLYKVTGLERTDPGLALVHQKPKTGCAMPLVIGDFWIQANSPEHRVFALDIHDLEKVRSVSSVTFDDRQRPHWLATDGSRIVVVNEPNLISERRLWMLQLNRATGQLALDSAFRDAGSQRPGITFDRADWPHGSSGQAIPHGTVFGW